MRFIISLLRYISCHVFKIKKSYTEIKNWRFAEDSEILTQIIGYRTLIFAKAEQSKNQLNVGIQNVVILINGRIIVVPNMIRKDEEALELFNGRNMFTASYDLKNISIPPFTLIKFYTEVEPQIIYDYFETKLISLILKLQIKKIKNENEDK